MSKYNDRRRTGNRIRLIDALIESNWLLVQMASAVFIAILLLFTLTSLWGLVETVNISSSDWPSLDFTGNLVAISLSTFGVAITIFISIRQAFVVRRQVDELSQIRDISANLQQERILAENVPRYFHTVIDSKKKLNCFVPCEEKDTPLPTVKVGDHIALQVYDKFLTSEQIQLVWVIKRENESDDIRSSQINGHTFFIGSPMVNTALKTVFTDETIEAEKIPLWFSKDETSGSDDFKPTVILNTQTFTPWESAADPLYDHNHPAHDRMRGSTTPIEDRAIIARIEVDGILHFVTAGIHQFGTWIAAEFLHSLITETLTHTDQFADLYTAAMSQVDFIVHIKGNFDRSSLQTEGYSIQELYVKDRGIWSPPS